MRIIKLTHAAQHVKPAEVPANELDCRKRSEPRQQEGIQAKSPKMRLYRKLNSTRTPSIMKSANLFDVQVDHRTVRVLHMCPPPERSGLLVGLTWLCSCESSHQGFREQTSLLGSHGYISALLVALLLLTNIL